MEGTGLLAQASIEPRTGDSTGMVHACGLERSSASQTYGHIQSILSTDPLGHRENIGAHGNSLIDCLHENGMTIDENIWSILGDSSMVDVPVFATSALTTKSRVTFSDHVEHFTVVPYSEIYGAHPKIIFFR